MVSYSDVTNNNASLRASGSGLTAVFVGATNGIGLGAFRALVSSTDAPTIYLVGRSAGRLQPLIDEAKSTNPTATIHPILAKDLTLIKVAQTAANEIASSAKKIDLLILSPGYLATIREETPEGLDACQSIRFYARMRFLVTLAPLLRAAPSPRVVSVLAGGQEGPLDRNDLTMARNYGLIKAAGASASLTTLFLEQFARQPGNEKISLVHLYPGFVGDTGIIIKGVSWYIQLLLDWVAVPIMRLVGYTPKEAGERVVFAATNGRYRRLQGGSTGQGTLVEQGSDGTVGSGVYLVQADGSVMAGNKILEGLRQEGMGEVVYHHTMEKFKEVEGLS